MWTRTHSQIVIGLNKEDIWKVWTDVNSWPLWHSDLDSCQLSGPFAAGQHFMLKPKGMRPVKIALTDVQNGSSFTDCTCFFGAKMVDTHTIEECEGGLRLTNTVQVSGPLSWLWIKLVAQHVADSSKSDMQALIARVQHIHGKAPV